MKIRYPVEDQKAFPALKTWRLKADNCLLFRRKDGRAAGETVPFSEILDNYRLLTDLKHVQSTLIVWEFSFLLGDWHWWASVIAFSLRISYSNFINLRVVFIVLSTYCTCSGKWAVVWSVLKVPRSLLAYEASTSFWNMDLHDCVTVYR